MPARAPTRRRSAGSAGSSRPTVRPRPLHAWTRTQASTSGRDEPRPRARDQQRRAPERDRPLPRQQEHDRLRAPLGALDSVLPDQRAGPVHELYRWTNRTASEDDKIVTNPDGFQFKDPSGNVLGTLDMMKRYKALMFVAEQALQPPLERPDLVRALQVLRERGQQQRGLLRQQSPRMAAAARTRTRRPTSPS